MFPPCGNLSLPRYAHRSKPHLLLPGDTCLASIQQPTGSPTPGWPWKFPPRLRPSFPGLPTSLITFQTGFSYHLLDFLQLGCFPPAPWVNSFLAIRNIAGTCRYMHRKCRCMGAEVDTEQCDSLWFLSTLVTVRIASEVSDS